MASKFDRLMLRFEEPIVRSAIFGLVGAAMYLSVVILWNAQSAEQANDLTAGEHAAQDAGHARSRAQRSCKGSPSEKQLCTQEIYDRAREQQRREYEVAADRNSAVWDEAMGEAAIMGGILGLLTVAFLFYGFRLQAQANIITKKAADDTLAETRRIGEAQVRCYLTGISAQLGFVSDGEVMVNCKVKNTGQSPARGVESTGEISFSVGENHYRRFDEPTVRQFTPRVDIGTSIEEWVTFSIKAPWKEWAATGGTFFVTVEIKLLAKDVFGKPAPETEKFVASPVIKPAINTWLDLKRTAHLT